VSKLPYILCAVVIGAILTIQPGLNANVAQRIGSPFGAGLMSVIESVIVALVLFFVTRETATWSATLSMPWYLWLAGSIGTIFVVATLWLAPILGAALLFAAIVAGQMIGSTTADLLGLSGHQGQSFDPWRIAGIGLVLAGVLVFQRAG